MESIISRIASASCCLVSHFQSIMSSAPTPSTALPAYNNEHLKLCTCLENLQPIKYSIMFWPFYYQHLLNSVALLVLHQQPGIKLIIHRFNTSTNTVKVFYDSLDVLLRTHYRQMFKFDTDPRGGHITHMNGSEVWAVDRAYELTTKNKFVVVEPYQLACSCINSIIGRHYTTRITEWIPVVAVTEIVCSYMIINLDNVACFDIYAVPTSRFNGNIIQVNDTSTTNNNNDTPSHTL